MRGGPSSWGIVGFGEAGSVFARYICIETKRPVLVTDPILNRARVPEIVRRRLGNLAIEIAPDVPSLAKKCDVVLSLVTPSAAPKVVMQAAKVPGLDLLVDFNTLSPVEKKPLGEAFGGHGYVDGSILGSVVQEGRQMQLALSGTRARRAADLLRSVGFHPTVVGSKVGAASALKACRSIFMKGTECLLVETLMAAQTFGISNQVLESIQHSIEARGFLSMVNMLVTTHAAHCGRRSHEMRSVIRMLEDLGFSSHMCRGSLGVLNKSFRSGLPNRFKREVPQRYSDVVDVLISGQGRRTK